MEKNPYWHGLYSGPPRYTSEEEFREQWKRAPKILGPSIAERIIAAGPSKAKSAENPSEPKPAD